MRPASRYLALLRACAAPPAQHRLAAALAGPAHCALRRGAIGGTAPAAPPHWSQASRGFACRTKFDAPEPKLVLVEYDPAYLDSFIELADGIEAEFNDVQVEGADSKTAGAFEFRAESGALLFSKLQASRAPRLDELLAAIRAKVEGAGSLGAVGGGDGAGCTL